MTKIGKPDKNKFTVNQSADFNISGEDLGSVTGDQVLLFTCSALRDGSTNKKLIWGSVNLMNDSTDTNLHVQVYLRSFDVVTKPTGGLLGFLIRLWAVIRGLWSREPTGDLTITITDDTGDVLDTATFTGVIYTPSST